MQDGILENREFTGDGILKQESQVTSGSCHGIFRLVPAPRTRRAATGGNRPKEGNIYH